ncbi:hypothetical protein [Paucibacter sp. M5-1]|uniref:hypothetical protein n=1 Tax=Paucibacter sp. M5-1 TaxID=3015998 RepID=UPI0022B8F46C|nr:hypothetical protein [Paucibacter sp. M5-1]MCZ7884263.1 hypothetical protein [Paucibacter sp. M5-1]
MATFALKHALVSVAAPTTDLKLMTKQFFEAHELFWNESPPPSIYSPELKRLLSLNSKCITESPRFRGGLLV